MRPNRSQRQIILVAPGFLFSLALIGAVFSMPRDEKTSKTAPPAESYVARARRSFDRDRFDEARDFYQKALKADPLNAGIWIDLGSCYWELGKFALAEEIFDQAARIKPRDFEVFKKLGDVYRTRKKCERAIEIYHQAAKLNPADSEIRIGLGVCYQELQRYGKARDMFEEAARLDPGGHRPYLEWGRCCAEEKKWEEARRVFKQAIELEPGEIDAYLELAHCSSYPEGAEKKIPEEEKIGKETGKEQARGEKPNIILFSIDTLRADRLGCYGHNRETSPFIDRFVRETVFFENAISQSPHTAPSHMSIFTALMPDVHLVSNYATRKITSRLPPRITTLAEVLRDEGYCTVGFHAPINVNAALGFDRGFDHYAPTFDERELGPGELPRGIKKWIGESKRNKKPLFLFLHHLYCHSPYVFGLREYRTHFLAKKVEGLPVGVEDIEIKNAHASFWKNIDLSDPVHREHVLALYDGGVYFSDYLFEKTIELLQEAGYYDNSVIVLLSDHGEEFFEHGGKEHEHLFIEHLHVPLMIKFPNGEYQGTRIKTGVRLVDLLPTLLEYLQIPIRFKNQGVSFLPLIRRTGGYNPLIVSHAIRGGKVRFVENGFVYSDDPVADVREWLFEAGKDPGERNNLADLKPGVMKLMRERAKKVKEEKKNFVDLIESGGGDLPRIDDELEERLRSLGYVR